MELPSDIVRTITSYLDDTTLQVVFMAGAIPALISISRDQRFWHERVQTLSGKRLQWIDDKKATWSRAYAILKQELAKSEPSFVNKEDNFIVTLTLLAMRFDPAVSNNDALKNACNNGRLQISKVLLGDSRVDPSDAYSIHAAAQGKHLEIVKLLLLDPRTSPKHALNGVARAVDEDLFKLILEDRRLILEPSSLDQALRNACNKGHTKIVEIILSSPNIDLDKYVISMAITAAAGSNEPSIIRLLFADPRSNSAMVGSDALKNAIKSGNLEIAKILLADPRMNPSIRVDVDSPLVLAAELGREDMVDLLLNHRLKSTANNNSAVMRAVQRKHLNIAKMILDSKNVNIDITLSGILQYDSAEVVKYILDNFSVDPSLIPYMAQVAVEHRQMDVARELLLVPGIDIRKILPGAIEEGNLGLVRLLLQDKAHNVGTYCKYFVKAAARGHNLVVLLLLRDGRIDPAFNDNQALREARTAGRAEVVRLLLADSRVQEQLR